jgi:hypothetical protein
LPSARFGGSFDIEERESRATDGVDLCFHQSRIRGGFLSDSEIGHGTLEVADVQVKFCPKHGCIQNQSTSLGVRQAASDRDGTPTQLPRLMICIHCGRVSRRLQKTACGPFEVPSDFIEDRQFRRYPGRLLLMDFRKTIGD